MTAPSSTQPPEGASPPFDPAVVVDLFRTVDKALRAIQLYLPNNPSYQRAIESARKAFAPIWEQTDDFRVTIADTRLVWEGVVVHEQKEKGGDSLPWLFYKDGIRELTFLKGFEAEEELPALLQALALSRRAQAHEDDLLTLMWEQGFSLLKYRYVELREPMPPIDAAVVLGDQAVPPGAMLEPIREAIAEAHEEISAMQEESGTPPDELPPDVVKLSDFESSLYFLDNREIEYLRQEALREYRLDLRRQVILALLDVLEYNANAAIRNEVADHLETMIGYLLSVGHYATVAHLLRETSAIIARSRNMGPAEQQRLVRIELRLNQPEVLERMFQLLEDSLALPSPHDLAELFSHLQPMALPLVLEFQARSRNSGLRPLLATAAQQMAERSAAALIGAIKDERAPVSVAAIRLAGVTKAQGAIPALADVITLAPTTRARLAAVTALAEISTPPAMAAVATALDDVDREIRLMAARALSARPYRPAVTMIEAYLKGPRLKAADRIERVTAFECYGLHCGDAGVPWLSELLVGKGRFLVRKGPSELRACAAIALGRVGTSAAQATLRAVANDADFVVRSAVGRALREGGRRR
ncbi:MAG: hypothetical protein RL625_864 [Gemmatimonadota bacterium]|jgi:HEAT repeat protein